MSLYTTAYGELVTLPSTQVLQSFSFYLLGTAGSSVSGNIDLEIAQWNASLNQATGPIVYSSPSPAFWNGGVQTLTFNNINTVLQGSSQYVVYMTLATTGATTQNYISNPANNISAYEGTVSTIFNGLVWSNSNGIDPLFDPSAWLTPASIGWAPRAFEVSATTLPYSTSPSSAGVPGPGCTVIALLAVLGLGLLTARRKTA